MIRSWRNVVKLGVLAWLSPVAIASLALPFQASNRPLFESIMALAVTATAVVLGLTYLRRVETASLREGFLVGLIWFGMCLALDLPLMLLSGFLQMTVGEYLADIGLTYAMFPVVASGMAAARARAGRE